MAREELPPDAELNRLRERVRNLAKQKSHYQMVSEMLTNIAAVSGLEDTVQHAVETIMDALGGYNVLLYYKTGQNWFLCDINHGPEQIFEIEDPEVLSTLKEGKFLEFDHSDKETNLTYPDALNKQRSWIYPLQTGERIFGILKMEGVILEYAEDVKGELGLIVKYLGMALWDEIVSSGKLLTAYEALQEESRKLKIEMEERRGEEARYRSTIESSFDGFWILTLSGRFLEVNKAYCLMIGFSREELLSMKITDLEVMERSEDTRRRMYRIIRDGRGKFETKHRHRNGNIIDVEVNTTYTSEKGGLFYVFIRDLTERNRIEMERSKLENQLQQAQKVEAVGTLAGGIAHDFNNLLFPLIGYSELLLDELSEGSSQYKKVVQILKAAERSRDLVRQILSFSRHSDEEKKAVYLQEILDEAMLLLNSSIPKSIEILKDIDQEAPPILANSTQLHQVIINLVTNASHAVLEKGGRIFVSLSEVIIPHNFSKNSESTPGPHLLLAIRDEGSGIRNENLDKIFDPYFTTKERGKGTGLGLAVVQGIIKNHKGSISVSSTPGEGAEFHILFPVLKRTTEKTVAAVTSLTPGHQERILVVDDEDYIVEIERMILEEMGYKVVPVVGSREAYSVFMNSKEPFSLLITDMTMPHYSGIQLIEMIRETEPDLPVIICTGYSDKIDPGNKEEFGVDKVLMKPVTRKALAAAVVEVLK